MLKRGLFACFALIAVLAMAGSLSAKTHWQKNWEVIPLPENVGSSVVFRQIDFYDKDHGVVVGEYIDPPIPGVVLIYEDGVWERDMDFPECVIPGNFSTQLHPLAVAYISPNNIIVGANGEIYQKKDGQWSHLGQTRLYYGEGQWDYKLIEISRFAKFSSSHIIGAGMVWSCVFEFFNSDSGFTWAALDSTRDPMWGIRAHSWESIVAVDSLHAWVGGTGWSIMATKDGGKTWQIQRRDQTYPAWWNAIRSISFCDTLNGWAVGDRRRVFKTYDGGKNWIRVEDVPLSSRYSKPSYVKVISPDEIWLWSGEKLLHTMDGGDSWEVAYNSWDGEDFRVAWGGYFLSPNEAWFVGSGGLFLHYTRTLVPNKPPVITSWTPEDTIKIEPGTVVLFEINVEDPDGDEVTCEWAFFEEGKEVRRDRPYSWATSHYYRFWRLGESRAEVIVSDGEDTTSHCWVVIVEKSNHAPVFTSPEGTFQVSEGDTLSLVLRAEDEDGDELIFFSQDLPQGANLVDSLFTWIPNFDQAGEYDVSFIVSDGKATDTTKIKINVSNVNRAPVIVSYCPESDTLLVYEPGEELYFTVAAQDPDGDSLSFQWFLDGKPKSRESRFTFDVLRTRAQVKVAVSDLYTSVSRTWLVILEIPVSVEEEEDVLSFALKCFPNPSNTSVQIQVQLPQKEKIYLEIYDMLGRKVRTLANGSSLLVGNHTYIWDGRDKRGIPVASGIYICRLTSDHWTESIKIMILR